MIIAAEGLSAVGKTTLINKILEKRPNWIRFRGAGSVNVGIGERWQEYNFWMHNIIEQLDKLNDYKQVILWDRFLTDAVYSENEEYRSNILRAIRSHKNKMVIYIKVPSDILHERSTKIGGNLDQQHRAYIDVLSSFEVFNINPKEEDNYYITDKIVDDVIEQIEFQLNKNNNFKNPY